jgi:hypothetical protein
MGAAALDTAHITTRGALGLGSLLAAVVEHGHARIARQIAPGIAPVTEHDRIRPVTSAPVFGSEGDPEKPGRAQRCAS